MALGGLAFILGSVMQAAAPGIVMLVVGRVLLGVGIGFANQVRHLTFLITRGALSQ